MFSYGMFNQPPQPPAAAAPTLPTLTSGPYGLQAAPGVDITTGSGGAKPASYTSLGMTTAAIDELILFIGGQTAARQIVFDVQVGGSGTAVSDFHLYVQANAFQMVRLPIRIASGQSVGLRFGTNTGSVNMRVMALGVSSSVPQTLTSVAAIVASTTPYLNSGVTLTTGGGWTAVGSPLAAAASAIMPTLGSDNDPSRTAGVLQVEISIDGGTTTLATFVGYQFTTGLSQPVAPIIWGSFPIGTQFHMRVVAPSGGSDTFNANIHAVR